MKFKKSWIYYIVGTIVFIVLFGIDKMWTLFLLTGFSLGYLLHNWLNNIFVDWKNAFFTDELRKREMKKKELEQELEKLKQGD
jgi:hypothetical protein